MTVTGRRLAVAAEETRGAEYHQYYERVGTVTNVSVTQNMHVMAAGREPLPDDALLAPTLIDRRQHSTLVFRALNEMRNAGRTSHLFLVPGCPDDRHEALVQRCSKVELPQGAAGPWKDARSVAWPEWPGATLDDVLDAVAEALSLGQGMAAAHIEGAVSEMRTHICISHLIDRARWEADSGRLVQEWVRYMAGGSLRPAEGYLLVAFLCLEVEERPTRTCRRILRFLDDLRGDSSAGQLLVTPPLERIRSVHVREWSDTISRSPDFPSLSGTSFSDLPTLLFQSASEERRFGLILPEVTKIIAARLPIKPRFEEICR